MATDTHDPVVLHGETYDNPSELIIAEAGMPQLDGFTYWNQAASLVLALVAIYFILKKVALPRIEMVLAERRGTISNDIAAAEELKSQALEAEKAYQQALADARAESARIVAEAKAEIQADLDVATAKADAEIAARVAESETAIAEIRAGAVEAVEAVAKDTAAALVGALGMKADEAAIADAVSAKLKG